MEDEKLTCLLKPKTVSLLHTNSTAQRRILVNIKPDIF